MCPKRSSVCAFVAALALLVSSCSGGGGKHAAPITIATTTTTRIGTTGRVPFLSTRPTSYVDPGISPSHVVIATGGASGLRLNVLAVDRKVQVGRAVDHPCVAVTFEYHNVGLAPVEVFGHSLLSIQLRDEGGPITDSTLGRSSIHLAAPRYWSCSPLVFPPRRPGTFAGAVEIASPPDRTLTHGAIYGPFTLHFQLVGPSSQQLAVLWAGWGGQNGPRDVIVVPLP